MYGQCLRKSQIVNEAFSCTSRISRYIFRFINLLTDYFGTSKKFGKLSSVMMFDDAILYSSHCFAGVTGLILLGLIRGWFDLNARTKCVEYATHSIQIYAYFASFCWRRVMCLLMLWWSTSA